MESAKLYYVDGSPFARLCRALIIDWQLPVEMIEVSYPLPESFFEKNPLGQVPLLETVGETIFPTAQITEQLWAMTSESFIPSFDPLADRQLLTVILTLGDLLVSARYQQLANLKTEGENQLGFDPATRNLERAQHTLDWIEAQADKWLTGDEVAVADYALAAILLWTDSRGPIEWRNRPKIARIIEKVGAGDSFAATAPQPWVPVG
jgi:glutathione S-transferase